MKQLTAGELRKLTEKVEKELSELQKNGDTETAHWLADELLCELLTGLGYKDIVGIYKGISKWYA